MQEVELVPASPLHLPELFVQPEVLNRRDGSPYREYMNSLSKSSRRTMAQSLGVICTMIGYKGDPELFPWHQLRRAHVMKLRSEIEERYAVATGNKMLVAVRRVIQEARLLGLISSDDCANACSVKKIKGSSLVAGRALSEAEIDALYAALPSERAIDVRDRALLAVLLHGLRRSEIVDLDLEHYRPAVRELEVFGKGRVKRLVPLMVAAIPVIDAWITLRTDRGGEKSPIFIPMAPQGHIFSYRRMTEQTVYSSLQRMVDRAKSVGACSPHDFRRTFISHLLDGGADIASVQLTVGHKEITTTQKYDRRGEIAKQKAVDVATFKFG